MKACKLCQTLVEKLVDSHLIPRAAYKMIRSSPELRAETTAANINLFENEAFPSTKQIHEYLLCTTCEKRFSDNGEAHMGNLWATRKNFGLRDLLYSISPIKDNCYNGSDLGTTTSESLVYFAISVLWRANVWPQKLGDYNGVLGKKYEKIFRDYLLEKTKLKNVKIVIYVNTNKNNMTNSLITFPGMIATPIGKVHTFTVPGLQFQVIVGKTVNSLSVGFDELESNILLMLEDITTSNLYATLTSELKTINRRGSLKNSYSPKEQAN